MSTVSKSIDLGAASTTQYLQRADNAAIRVANGWTVEFLILLNTPNANAYIAYSRSGENGWGITLANPSGNNYVIRVEGGSGSYGGANGTVNIYDGKWHHVRVYYNGASTKLYIDGVLDSTLNVPTISNPSQTVYFGTKAAGVGTYLHGGLSVIRIWDNEHTAADYTTVYGSAQTNMKAEWSLDGVLTDASGNGLTLTASATSGTTPTYLTSAHPDMQVSGRAYIGHHDDSNGVQSGTTTNTKDIWVQKAGSMIVVLISSATAGDNHGTPTIDGNNMTQVESAITGTNRRGTLWYYPNLSVGSHTLSISPSSISNRYSWGFTVVENVKTSSPVDVSGVGGAETGTSRTATLSLTQANSAMFVANYNLYDAGTNSTKLFGTGDDENLFSNCDEKSTGNFSMTATSSSSQNAYIAVAFKIGSQTYNQSLTATAVAVTATITTAKTIVQTLTATAVAVTSTLAKVPGKLLSGTAEVSAQVLKGLSMTMTATAVAVTATMEATRVFLQALNASVAVTATLTRGAIGKLLESTAAVTATITKTHAYLKTLSATAVEVTATIDTARGKILEATVAVTATIQTSLGKTLSAIVEVIAKVRPSFWRTKYPAHGDGDDYEIKYPHD